MVASAVFILDVKGKVLISRNYRGDIPMSAVEKFIPMVLEVRHLSVFFRRSFASFRLGTG